MTIKIFLFHRVSPQRDILWDPIAPEKFDQIIRFISKNYEVVQLEKAILEPPRKTDKPFAAFVFDDGYRDFILYALPILKKYNCPTSMYVVTDCIEQQLPPWTYILDYHFIHSKILKLQLDTALLPESLKNTSFSNTEARFQFAKQFKPYLKKLPNQTRVQLYNQVLASLNDVQAPSDLIMNWEELAVLKAEHIEIGSHTKSHPLLNKLETETEIKAEIKGSGELIAKHLGNFPKTISYPIGGYSETVKKVALESGYQLGLAVNQEIYHRDKNDRFEIPRIELYNESFLKCRLRISGIISIINKKLNR